MTKPVPIEVLGDTVVEIPKAINLSIATFSVGGVPSNIQSTVIHTVIDDDFSFGDLGDTPAPYPMTLAENGERFLATRPPPGATRDMDADDTHPHHSGCHGMDEDGLTFGTVQTDALDNVVTVNI